jgi:hypothetical protein
VCRLLIERHETAALVTSAEIEARLFVILLNIHPELKWISK